MVVNYCVSNCAERRMRRGRGGFGGRRGWNRRPRGEKIVRLTFKISTVIVITDFEIFSFMQMMTKCTIKCQNFHNY